MKKIALALTALSLTNIASASLPSWENQISIPLGSITQIQHDEGVVIEQTSDHSFNVTSQSNCLSSLDLESSSLLLNTFSCMSTDNASITISITHDDGSNCEVTLSEIAFGTILQISDSSCPELNTGMIDNNTQSSEYELTPERTGIDRW